MQNHTFVRLGKVEKRVLMFGVTTLKNLVTRPLCRRQGWNLKQFKLDDFVRFAN
jgi:hypothetical protein